MNQGELDAHCLFIGMNDAGFNSRCLSNVKRLFSETLSSKHIGQLRFDKEDHHDAVLVFFTITPPKTTTANHTG